MKTKILFLAGALYCLCSCVKDHDLYNPDLVKEQYNANWEKTLGKVDPNQTWNTATACNASVTVNDAESYTLKVYTDNPYNVNSNAMLLAQTSVEGGKTANFTFDIPVALQYVYVMKVNSKGYSSVIPASVENGTMKVMFGKKDVKAQTAMATRGGATRAAIWEPTVPSLDDTNIFPTEAPADSNPYTGQWEVTRGTNYIITSSTINISCNQSVNFYIKGKVSISSIYAQGPLHLYLLPNAEVTITGGLNLENVTTLSIGKGVLLKCDGLNLSNSSGTVYNAGTIEAKGQYLDSRNNSPAFYNLGTFQFTKANLSNIHFYNGGEIKAATIDNNGTTTFINAEDATIDLTDKFSCENGSSIAVNKGTINANSFGLGGSSSFYNESNGKITISGESTVDSNSSVWDNEGAFTSKNMYFKANSKNWTNKCKLIVSETLDIQTSDGTVKMDAGSYIECRNLIMDMARIEMREGSFFNVTGLATLKWNTNTNGFASTGENYAIVKMAQAVRTGNSRINYSGKLYIDCSDHFEQGDKSSPYYTLSGEAQFVGNNGADIQIPTSLCNPGYNSTPDSGQSDKDTPQAWIIACEDLGNLDDFDFNDVVFEVKYVAGEATATIIPLAAGGTLPATIFVTTKDMNGNPSTREIGEIHQLLDPSSSTSTMLNTHTKGKAGAPITFNVGNGFSISTGMGSFTIQVTKDGSSTTEITPPGKGTAPQMICIPAPWAWPIEKAGINEAYPKIGEWGANYTSSEDWYLYPTEEKIVK